MSFFTVVSNLRSSNLTMLSYWAGITKVISSETTWGSFRYDSPAHTTKRKEYYKSISVYILCHNFKDEVISKNRHIIDKGVKFIVPFPDIEIIE